MADKRNPLRPRIGPSVLSSRLPAQLRNTRIAQLIKITGGLLQLRRISIRAKQQNLQRHPIILLLILPALLNLVQELLRRQAKTRGNLLILERGRLA